MISAYPGTKDVIFAVRSVQMKGHLDKVSFTWMYKNIRFFYKDIYFLQDLFTRTYVSIYYVTTVVS